MDDMNQPFYINVIIIIVHLEKLKNKIVTYEDTLCKYSLVKVLTFLKISLYFKTILIHGIMLNRLKIN